MADITLIFEEQPISLELTTATPINLVLDGGATYTAGTGISITGAVITNTAPNIVQELSISGQDLTLSGGGGTVAIPGGIAGSGASPQLSIFSGASTIFGNSRFTVNNSSLAGLIIDGGDGAGGNGSYIQFRKDGANNFIFGAESSLFGGTGTGGAIFQYGNNPFFFCTQSTKRMVITGTGEVGINTLSPTSKIDVLGAAGYSQLRLRTAYTPTGTADALGSTGDTAWDDNFFYIKTAAGWKRAALSTF